MIKRVSIILVIAIPLMLIIWSFTVPEYKSIMCYGCIIKMMDKGSAEMYGLEKAGTYIGLENGNALPAVRGGLKLIFSFQDPGRGLRAIGSHGFFYGDGLILTGSLVVWIAGIVFMIFFRKKKVRQE